MDLLDLIHEAAHSYRGGVEALAARMDKKPDTLRKKVLPTNDTHDLTVKELRTIIDYVDTDKVAQGFASDRGLMCINKPSFDGFSDSAILDLFLALQKEQGEWSSKIGEALMDGEITWDELSQIRKEYNDFIVASAEIMSRLESYMATSEEIKARRLSSVK